MGCACLTLLVCLTGVVNQVCFCHRVGSRSRAWGPITIKDSQARCAGVCCGWVLFARGKGKMVDRYLSLSVWRSRTIPAQTTPALLSHSVLVPLKSLLGPPSTQGLVTWTCPGQYLDLDLPLAYVLSTLVCRLYTPYPGQARHLSSWLPQN